MSDRWKLGKAGRGGAEAERIGGAEAEPPTARAEDSRPETQQRGRGQPERLRRGRASPALTGCTQSHQERPQGQGSPQGWTETPAATQHTLTASTGARGRHTLPEVVRGYPGHPHATHSPSDAPQATTGGTGAQLPTHRAKTSNSRPG